MKLKEIVDTINITLKTALNQEKFQSGVYNGLAKLVKIKNADNTDYYISTIYNNEGKEIDCTGDDNISFQIYHRCISMTLTQAQIAQFGDQNNTKETANMIAVVYGKKQIIGMAQEDLASVVNASFPSELTITELQKTLIKTTTINNDSYAVYTQEYKSTDYPLNPQDYYFSIGYTVETTYDKTCVDKCLC